jgi:hypothetical protein
MASVFEQIASDAFDALAATQPALHTAIPLTCLPGPCPDDDDGTTAAAAELANLLSRVAREQTLTLPHQFEDCTRLLEIIASSDAQRTTALALRGHAAKRILDALQSVCHFLVRCGGLAMLMTVVALEHSGWTRQRQTMPIDVWPSRSS